MSTGFSILKGHCVRFYFGVSTAVVSCGRVVMCGHLVVWSCGHMVVVMVVVMVMFMS